MKDPLSPEAPLQMGHKEIPLVSSEAPPLLGHKKAPPVPSEAPPILRHKKKPKRWKRRKPKDPNTNPPTTQPPLPLPISNHSRLPYQTRFWATLPLIPFYQKNQGERLFSLRHGFGSLYSHLWSCDPTSTIIPNLNQCSQSTQATIPPLGAAATLKDYPTSIDRIQRYIRNLQFTFTNEQCTATHCLIVIDHTVELTELLTLINGLDKYQHRPYSFVKQHKRTHSRTTAARSKAATILNTTDASPTEAPLCIAKRPNYKAQALCLVLETSGDSMMPSPLWAFQSPQPMKSQVALPLTTSRDSPPAHSISRQHSATVKPSLGLRWLLAVLERQWTTSWDLASSPRLWDTAGAY
jgi:hypothetical protein